MTLVAISIAWAIVIASWFAWDFGRRWLQEQSARRVADERIAHQDTRIDLLDQSLASLVKERKAMAEDWMKKFVQLERDWQKLKMDAETRYQGAIAQAESVQPRGYHRG